MCFVLSGIAQNQNSIAQKKVAQNRVTQKREAQSRVAQNGAQNSTALKRIT